ncbi:MAG: hypothetical protein H0V35_12195 [Nitrospira sp.]|nr:hypothetical protein [Nitrospira sp.]
MAAKRPLFTEKLLCESHGHRDIFGLGWPARLPTSIGTALVDETILCRFPQYGRAFLNRAIKSTKAKELTKDLRRLLKKGDDLRERLMEDHLVLYLVQQGRIVFLAIKHHRQLSFDLKHFWQEE